MWWFVAIVVSAISDCNYYGNMPSRVVISLEYRICVIDYDKWMKMLELAAGMVRGAPPNTEFSLWVFYDASAGPRQVSTFSDSKEHLNQKIYELRTIRQDQKFANVTSAFRAARDSIGTYATDTIVVVFTDGRHEPYRIHTWWQCHDETREVYHEAHALRQTGAKIMVVLVGARGKEDAKLWTHEQNIVSINQVTCSSFGSLTAKYKYELSASEIDRWCEEYPKSSTPASTISNPTYPEVYPAQYPTNTAPRPVYQPGPVASPPPYQPDPAPEPRPTYPKGPASTPPPYPKGPASASPPYQPGSKGPQDRPQPPQKENYPINPDSSPESGYPAPPYGSSGYPKKPSQSSTAKDATAEPLNQDTEPSLSKSEPSKPPADESSFLGLKDEHLVPLVLGILIPLLCCCIAFIAFRLMKRKSEEEKQQQEPRERMMLQQKYGDPSHTFEDANVGVTGGTKSAQNTRRGVDKENAKAATPTRGVNENSRAGNQTRGVNQQNAGSATQGIRVDLKESVGGSPRQGVRRRGLEAGSGSPRGVKRDGGSRSPRREDIDARTPLRRAAKRSPNAVFE